MKQVREVLVRELVIYFYLQIAVLITVWTVFGVLVGLKIMPAPIWAAALVAAALSYMPLRCFVIGCVLMYKAYAPLSVRDQCRFTPTCSTYMIMAVKKYGLVLGIIKGVRRILRCKPPNGGEDLP